MVKLCGLVGAALLFVACATDNLSGQHRDVLGTLYFGTEMSGGQVSESDWQKFLANVITPRFPKGVTSWVAAGQWQNRDGSLARETSHVVLLIHSESPQSDQSISEIISTYKKQFRQEAVLHVRSPAQVSFQ